MSALKNRLLLFCRNLRLKRQMRRFKSTVLRDQRQRLQLLLQSSSCLTKDAGKCTIEI